MQKLFFVIFFSISLAAAPVWGQNTNKKAPPAPSAKGTTSVPTLFAPPATTVSTMVPATTAPVETTSILADPKATPEMWFYEQYMKEYKNPKNAVRANAAADAQQRSNRLAAMRWFGLSNSRPRVSPDPVHVYPPSWASNTPLQPNRWQATGGQPYYYAQPQIVELR
jgi:hypothetical protein